MRILIAFILGLAAVGGALALSPQLRHGAGEVFFGPTEASQDGPGVSSARGAAGPKRGIMQSLSKAGHDAAQAAARLAAKTSLAPAPEEEAEEATEREDTDRTARVDVVRPAEPVATDTGAQPENAQGQQSDPP